MKWWIVVLVLGGVLTLSGTGIWKPSADPGDITCGSEVMGPGDVCEETQRGVVTDTYTYAEKLREEQEYARSYARSGRWVQLGIGLGLVAIAVTGIVVTKRRRARRAPTTADLYLQQQAAWQQPRQQVAQPAHFAPPPQHVQQQAQSQPQQQQPQWQPQPYQQPYPPRQYPDFGPRGH